MKLYWKRSENISSISPVRPTEITIVTSLFLVILTTPLIVAAASLPEALAFPWPFSLLRNTTWAMNRVQEECLSYLTIQVIAPPSHGWELCTHPFFNCLALEFPLRPTLVPCLYFFLETTCGLLICSGTPLVFSGFTERDTGPQIPTSFLPSVKTHKFFLLQDFIAIYVGCTGCCHTLPGSRLRCRKHSQGVLRALRWVCPQESPSAKGNNLVYVYSYAPERWCSLHSMTGWCKGRTLFINH